jgi:NAD(P)-dependent dehydrogenase (short-subunit alcohol dehydrogenase family)
MSRLINRTAIVTGASRGLGRAIALGMAAEGARVAVVARTEQVWDDRLPGTIGETVAAIEAAGGRAVAIRADLMEAADRMRLIDEARAALGPITILVNNAAFTAPGGPPRADAPARADASKPVATAGTKAEWPSFMNTPLRAYRRHFEMVFAAYDLMQMVVPDMEAAGYGSIINVTSGASRMPGEGPYPERRFGSLAGYGGSKAALEHLTLSAAYEVGDRAIAINALSPSRAFHTPGVAYYAREFQDFAPEAEFAEAAIRLALADPARVTGRVLGHADVLDESYRSYVFVPGT